MKFIHCADLHLDSRMDANLDKEHAKERRGEILHTFGRMVTYAVREGVSAILIVGDLFDKKNISATARNTVVHYITEHPGITFYYLKGNHDNDNFLLELDETPGNLKMFDSRWRSYEEAGGNVTISGTELSAANAASAYVSLVLDARTFNIVMLHGQEAMSASKERVEVINLKALKNKGIDYLALGHVHSYKKESLDARGTYCYAGCLEGRGFDECGEHGFVLLDVNEDTGEYTHEFIPFAARRLHVVEVDVSGCAATAEMVSRASRELAEAGCEGGSLVKIVLKGTVDVECEKDLAYFRSCFASQFYFVKVNDETVLELDAADYRSDASLKGEYVRQVMADDTISEEDKKIVIRYGLQAIMGEEVQ